MIRFPRRIRLWAWASVCACASTACSDEGIPSQKSADLGPDPSPLLFGLPAGTGMGGAGDGDAEGYDEPVPNTNATKLKRAPGDPGYIPVDPPRTWSLYCGDGAWDPDLEECDAGRVAQDDVTSVCSPNCQTRDVLVVDPNVTGKDASRRIGFGRHPLAGGQTAGALAWVEWGKAEGLPDAAEGSVPQIVVQTLDLHNSPDERIVVADGNLGDNPILGANPVVAAPSDATIVVAYNDLNGDGSELGIALKTLTRVDGEWSLGPTTYANQTTVGAQADPDLLATRDGLMGAWVDFSNPVGPRIVARNLSSGGAEIQVVPPGAPVGAVALAGLPRVFEDEEASPQVWAVPDRRWALAFREGEEDGPESIGVYSAGSIVRIQPAWLNDEPGDVSQLEGLGGAASVPLLERPMPGHMEDRPGVAHLAEHRVAVAFTVGTDPQQTGVANVFRLWVAVVDLKAGAVESVTEVEPLHDHWSGETDGRSLRQPALVSFGSPSRMYLAWRSEGALGSGAGEELWLKRLDWDADLEAIDFSIPEVPLARNNGVSGGDQRTPVLASLLVPGEAWLDVPTLGMAWEDWGVQYDPAQARPDVLLQVAPTPIRRGPPVETECGVGQCGVGQGPCVDDTSCQAGLVCAAERGPWYGLGHTTDVCQPPSCGPLDCGGDCGTCFECPDETTYQGTANYCSLVCPCDVREADCDADFECVAGLSCIEDVGATVGLPAAIDICEAAHCHNGVLDADESRRDCGGFDCLPCVNGTPTYCLDVDCEIGEGDCLPEGASCAAGLVCRESDAGLFGLDEGVGVCVQGTCDETRGEPNTETFCSVDCKCPPGYGICDSTDECVNSECVLDRGLYFGLEAEDGVCIPDHCSDGQLNYGETEVDCGGVCGSECPSCEVDPTFRSFEDGAQWGIVNYWLPGINPNPDVTTSSNATHGSSSLAVGTCGYVEVASIVIDGSQFESVGNRLLFDVNPQIGSGGEIWDWVGGFLPRVWVDDVVYPLSPEFSWARSGANEWNVIAVDVPQVVQDAFLSGTSDIQFRFGVNRNCGATGSSGSAFLIDNIRFGGDAAFRSDCEPDDDDGTGGSGGTGGTGGSGGTGGTGGSGGAGSGGAGSGGAGSGGTGSGGAGTGGSGTGGSGTGGSGGGSSEADDLFGFEDPSLWTGNPTTSTDTTQGDSSFTFGTGWHTFVGGPFDAGDVEETAVLSVDIKLPPAASAGSGVNGHIEFHFSCPSQSLYDQYVGNVLYWDKPMGVWFTGNIAVPQSIRDALASSATDCTVKMRSNLYSEAPGGMIVVDNLRFAEPTVCNSYTQQNSPPFAWGLPVTPNGTASAPYPICTVSQLQHVANNPSLWGAYYQLGTDIDLSTLTGKIGTGTTPFTGTFDGQGHVLSNFSLTESGPGAGLFGFIDGDGVVNGTADGAVMNLIAEAFDVAGTSYVGALVGYAEGAFLKDLHVMASSVTASDSYVGGIVGALDGTLRESDADVDVSASNAGTIGGAAGYVEGSLVEVSSFGSVVVTSGQPHVGGLVGAVASATMTDCQAHGSVSSDFGLVGGLAGAVLSGSTVEGAFATGNVFLSGSSEGAGGLVGYAEAAIIVDSAATGHVSAAANVGGFIGAADAGLVVQDCTASGSASGALAVGGFLGQSEGSGSITLERCAARGAVTATDSYGGGFVGFADTLVIRDSYAWGAVTVSTGYAGGFAGIASDATIQRSYSSGSVAAPSLVGAFLGSLATNNTFSNSFATSDNNGGLALIGDSASPSGVTFLSGAQLTTQSTFTSAGWDFSSVWMMGAWGPEL